LSFGTLQVGGGPPRPPGPVVPHCAAVPAQKLPAPVLGACTGSPEYAAVSGCAPGPEDAAATVQDAPPPGLGVSVHEFPPEKYDEPPPPNTMFPVAIDVDAGSLTIAVQALTLPTARLGGLQLTVVWVASIAESIATPQAPAGVADERRLDIGRPG
jgi:hypothetical protein